MKTRLLLMASMALTACGGAAGPDSPPSEPLPPLDPSTPPSERQGVKSFLSLDGTTTVPYLEYLPADYATKGGKTYPLLMFLHGGSGTGASDGSEIDKLLKYPIPSMIAGNHDMCFTTASGSTECFIVVSPQSSRTTGVWDINDSGGMLRHALKTYRVDPKRVYVTGVSMGGGGTWTLLAGAYADGDQSIRWASQIAAALPIASGARSATSHTGICSGIVANHTAVWAFHNSGDPVAALANEKGWVDKVNRVSAADGYTCAQAGEPAARLTIYPSNTHEGWTVTYDPTTQITSGVNAFQWLLSNQKP